MERPQYRLRAAPQPAAPALPAHAGRDRALQQTGHGAGRARRRGRTGRTDRRFPRPRRLRRHLPRLVFPAHDRLHLVVPHRPDAALPDRHHDSLLPQPRADPGRRPAAVAHRARWCEVLRGQAAAGHSRRAAEHTRAWREAAAAGRRPRRRDGGHRSRGRALRRSRAGLPQRPEPGAAGRRHSGGACRARRHPLPPQPCRAAHRRLRAAAAPPGLGGVELCARSRHRARAGRRVPALPHQPAAAAALGAAGAGVAEPRSGAAHSPGAGDRQLRLQPPGLRPRLRDQWRAQDALPAAA